MPKLSRGSPPPGGVAISPSISTALAAVGTAGVVGGVVASGEGSPLSRDPGLSAQAGGPQGGGPAPAPPSASPDGQPPAGAIRVRVGVRVRVRVRVRVS